MLNVCLVAKLVKGHDRKLVDNEFAIVGAKTREEVRRRTNKKSPGKAFFIAQFNPRGPSVNKVINKHLSVLANDPVASKVFPANSIKVINKRCQNLKELLVRADPYNTPKLSNCPKGTLSCKKCDSCKNFLVHSDSFTSFATKHTFQIKRTLPCKNPMSFI